MDFEKKKKKRLRKFWVWSIDLFHAVFCCLLPCPLSPFEAFGLLSSNRIGIVYRIIETIIEIPNIFRFDYIYIYILIERYIEGFGTISKTNTYADASLCGRSSLSNRHGRCASVLVPIWSILCARNEGVAGWLRKEQVVGGRFFLTSWSDAEKSTTSTGSSYTITYDRRPFRVVSKALDFLNLRADSVSRLLALW